MVESLADRFGGNFSRLGEGQPRLRDGRGETVIGVAAYGDWPAGAQGAEGHTDRAQVLRSLMQHTEQRAS